MGRKLGSSPRKAATILTFMFNNSGSAREIAKQTHVDPKTVFSLLRRLNRDGLVSKTQKGHPVVWHLPTKNYSRAMVLYGWSKDRPPNKRLLKSAQKLHEGMASMHGEIAWLFTPDPQSVLTSIAKKHLFIITSHLNLPDQLRLARSLREGTICLQCLNDGKGLHSASFDETLELYVCESCGVEQEREPFTRSRIEKGDAQR